MSEDTQSISFLTKEDTYQILLPGAFGALLVTWQDLSVAEFSTGLIFSLFVAMLLGSIAALAFIVVIAGTDRAEARKIIVLSILAGFSYQPVIDAARANLNLNTQIESQNIVIAEQQQTLEATNSAIDFTQALSEISQQALKDPDAIDETERLRTVVAEFQDEISELSEEAQDGLVLDLLSSASLIAPDQELPLASLLEEAELIPDNYEGYLREDIPRCSSSQKF